MQIGLDGFGRGFHLPLEKMSEQPPEEAKKPAEVVAADTTTELGTPVAGATTTATPSVHIYDTCPPEKTNLRILLVSGQKTDIPALPSDTVESFLNNCFDQWPLGRVLGVMHSISCTHQ